MATSSQTRTAGQLSAATALVQLLSEHPELSEHMSWSVSRTNAVLVGFVHDGGMPLLAECADILGGDVQSGQAYEGADGRKRQHVLSAVWRDVRVEILLSLPVAAEAVAA